MVKNKKSMSISIVVLVLLTLILVVLTITYFIISKKANTEILNVPSDMEVVYNQAESFNFYLNNIFDNVTRDFQIDEKISSDKSESAAKKFAEKFKAELDKRKFYSICDIKYSPVDESRVQIKDNKIILNMDIDISFGEEAKNETLVIKYNYEKSFEKKFD